MKTVRCPVDVRPVIGATPVKNVFLASHSPYDHRRGYARTMPVAVTDVLRTTWPMRIDVWGIAHTTGLRTPAGKSDGSITTIISNRFHCLKLSLEFKNIGEVLCDCSLPDMAKTITILLIVGTVKNTLLILPVYTKVKPGSLVVEHSLRVWEFRDRFPAESKQIFQIR